MSDISEEEWKRALTTILEELEKQQFIKFLEFLDKIPRSVRTEVCEEKMPGKIIQCYGLLDSISAVNEAVDQIPRKDRAVQDLLRPFVEKLKKHDEKVNEEDKRKHDEVEGEKRSAAGEKRKRDEVEEEESSALREKRKRAEAEEEESSSPDPLMSCQTVQERSNPPWKILIRDLKTRDPLLDTEAFFGKVIQKSGLRKYRTKGDEKKFFFYLAVADEEATVKVMVYGRDRYKVLKENSSYLFRNLIRDQNIVKVTKQSTVSQSKPVQVPGELELEAQKLIYPEIPLCSIAEAKKCPDKTNVSVEGTVKEIAPVEEVTVSYQQQKKKMQRLKLKDETDSIKICLWGEETKLCKDLSLRDTVKLTNMRTNDYYGEKTLNSTGFTKVHMVQTLGIQNVKIEIIGIQKATKKETHLEANFNQQLHIFVVASSLLAKELDIKLGGDYQERLLEKLLFIADVEIKGYRIKKLKVAGMM
ncbi:uncharacterized protein LOC117812720 [Notolabrus celidotus]|uniref:uncharacterized protein LOC117812720 n=1 Tax=Notolabrus celidotus TaxID=1203425 RepID=UPI0014906425|nr:uncharacterized protein LOC117812720 [Notolabrus celidotus]